jgi:hypothetical protein
MHRNAAHDAPESCSRWRRNHCSQSPEYATDTDTLIEYRPEKDSAMRRAQEIFTTTNNLCWKVVTVTKQIVVWLSEEQLLAVWKDTEEETEILTDDDYALYMSAKKEM